MRSLALVALVGSLSPLPLCADLIDFEDLICEERQTIGGFFETASNSLRIRLPGGDPLCIAEVGRSHFAFDPFSSPRNPDGSLYTAGGRYFLTDDSPSGWSSYNFAFERPVSLFQLDLYDFRPDGGAVHEKSQVHLRAFRDPAMLDLVGVYSYAANQRDVNGCVTNLVVRGDWIVSAILCFSGPGDVGTGIDNLSFDTLQDPPAPVPEPATLLLVAIGGAALASRRQKPVKASFPAAA
jgi:hypothetical protein